MFSSYPFDFSSATMGITFHLPTRHRFIPNCWMLHADMNEKETEIQIAYTQSLVTISGTNLRSLYQEVAKFAVGGVREMPTPSKESPMTVTRIEITEKIDA